MCTEFNTVHHEASKSISKRTGEVGLLEEELIQPHQHFRRKVIIRRCDGLGVQYPCATTIRSGNFISEVQVEKIGKEKELKK